MARRHPQYPCRRCKYYSYMLFLLATISSLGSHLQILHAAAGQVLLLPEDHDQVLLLPEDHDHEEAAGGHDDDHQEEDDDVDGIDRPRLYIVHLLPPENGQILISSNSSQEYQVEAWHKSFLPTPTTLDCGKPRLVHSYTEAISGFAAWLTPREVEDMRAMEGFVDAQPDEPLTLETTHTPSFLQLENGTGLWGNTNWGEGRLIGVIDQSIDPDHVSFAGVGMSPRRRPPWTGRCDFRCTAPAACSCTNKLLGATLFNNPTPMHDAAHGTMVASIAAGDFVAGAKDFSYPNYARGIASGASPRSYLSFYSAKFTSTFLQAIERAVLDRVDILCISLSLEWTAYHNNSLAIGTLSAVEQGIFVAMAAGNYGPHPRTVRNDAPWLLTVGASTHDRATGMAFYTAARTGHVNAREYYGVTQIHLADIFTGSKQLVYPGEGGGGHDVKTCNNNLGGKNVRGAIVLCKRDPRTVEPFLQAETVRKAGGRAMVLMNDRDDLDNVPYLHFFSVVIKHSDGLDIIKTYNFKNSGAVTGRFWPTKSVFNIRPCPVVSRSSSRGPGAETKGVLIKPDILGPGVNILGARNGSTDKFNAESGTSFATPHLAAIAALLKSRHPGWSPAAIRSAIITTADIEDLDGNPMTNHSGGTASLYDTGAGLVNPERADDPGLVYDITDVRDYSRVLCSLYTQAQVSLFNNMRRSINCATLGKLKPEELNYPSIAMTLSRMGKVVVHRTVTNVGPATSRYDCSVDPILPVTQVRVSVIPDQFTFTPVINEASFMVEAELAPGSTLPSGWVVESFLKCVSVPTGGHVVRSPLALIVP